MASLLQELTGFAPAFAFLALVFFVPGGLFLLAFGLGPARAAALGPAVSLALVSLAAVVFAPLGIPWTAATVLPFLGVTVAVAAAWLGRRGGSRVAVLPSIPLGASARWGVALGVLGGCTVTGLALVRGIGAAGTPSQGWDPIFHANVLQWIRESGQASPWEISPIYGGSRTAYYPGGWHAVLSLYPGSLIEAANASAVVIGALIWPLGLSFLASAVLPRHPAAWALTPLMGASFVSFPFAQLLKSGQWPNGLATALVPATLAFAVLILRQEGPGTGSPPLWRRWLVSGFLLTAAVVGCAAAHPSSVFALTVALAPFLIARISFPLRTMVRARPRTLLGVGVLLALAGTLTATVLSRSSLLANVMNYNRRVRAELPDAVLLAFFDLPRFPALEALTLQDFNLWVGILAIVGAGVALALRGARPLPFAWLSFIALYILAAGPENPLRWLTGVWYKDTQRLAPFIAMAGSILAALALAEAAAVFQRRVLRSSAVHPGTAVFVVAVLLGAYGAYTGSANFRSADRIGLAAQNYVTSDRPGTGVLSTGEQDFIKDAAQLLPRDAVVLGDPFNGETFFYTLGGVRVVYPQLGSPTGGNASKELLRTQFNEINQDPAVCAAVKTLGATHYYQDQPGGSHGSASLDAWPGLYGVPTGHGFDPVFTDGIRTLYAITACR